jgi:hypothetical protein
MKRIGHVAHGFAEAEQWDFDQYAKLSPDECRRIAKALRDRVYGTIVPDVRDYVAGLRRKRGR